MSDNTNKPLRDKFGHFISNKKQQPVVEKKTTAPKPVLAKRGVSKSVIVHTNGKKTNSGLMVDRSLDGFMEEIETPLSVNPTGKRNPWNPPVKAPENEYLKIYRVYNAPVSNGYRYVIAKNPPQSVGTVEIVMPLYDPKADIVALDRAIRKYRAETE